MRRLFLQLMLGRSLPTTPYLPGIFYAPWLIEQGGVESLNSRVITEGVFQKKTASGYSVSDFLTGKGLVLVPVVTTLLESLTRTRVTFPD